MELVFVREMDGVFDSVWEGNFMMRMWKGGDSFKKIHGEATEQS